MSGRQVSQSGSSQSSQRMPSQSNDTLNIENVQTIAYLDDFFEEWVPMPEKRDPMEQLFAQISEKGLSIEIRYSVNNPETRQRAGAIKQALRFYMADIIGFRLLDQDGAIIPLIQDDFAFLAFKIRTPGFLYNPGKLEDDLNVDQLNTFQSELRRMVKRDKFCWTSIRSRTSLHLSWFETLCKLQLKVIDADTGEPVKPTLSLKKKAETEGVIARMSENVLYHENPAAFVEHSMKCGIEFWDFPAATWVYHEHLQFPELYCTVRNRNLLVFVTDYEPPLMVRDLEPDRSGFLSYSFVWPFENIASWCVDNIAAPNDKVRTIMAFKLTRLPQVLKSGGQSKGVGHVDPREFNGRAEPLKEMFNYFKECLDSSNEDQKAFWVCFTSVSPLDQENELFQERTLIPNELACGSRQAALEAYYLCSGPRPEWLKQLPRALRPKVYKRILMLGTDSESNTSNIYETRGNLETDVDIVPVEEVVPRQELVKIPTEVSGIQPTRPSEEDRNSSNDIRTRLPPIHGLGQYLSDAFSNEPLPPQKIASESETKYDKEFWDRYHESTKAKFVYKPDIATVDKEPMSSLEQAPDSLLLKKNQESAPSPSTSLDLHDSLDDAITSTPPEPETLSSKQKSPSVPIVGSSDIEADDFIGASVHKQSPSIPTVGALPTIQLPPPLWIGKSSTPSVVDEILSKDHPTLPSETYDLQDVQNQEPEGVDLIEFHPNNGKSISDVTGRIGSEDAARSPRITQTIKSSPFSPPPLDLVSGDNSPLIPYNILQPSVVSGSSIKDSSLSPPPERRRYNVGAIMDGMEKYLSATKISLDPEESRKSSGSIDVPLQEPNDLHSPPPSLTFQENSPTLSPSPPNSQANQRLRKPSVPNPHGVSDTPRSSSSIGSYRLPEAEAILDRLMQDIKEAGRLRRSQSPSPIGSPAQIPLFPKNYNSQLSTTSALDFRNDYYDSDLEAAENWNRFSEEEQKEMMRKLNEETGQPLDKEFFELPSVLDLSCRSMYGFTTSGLPRVYVERARNEQRLKAQNYVPGIKPLTHTPARIEVSELEMLDDELRAAAKFGEEAYLQVLKRKAEYLERILKETNHEIKGREGFESYRQTIAEIKRNTSKPSPIPEEEDAYEGDLYRRYVPSE